MVWVMSVGSVVVLLMVVMLVVPLYWRWFVVTQRTCGIPTQRRSIAWRSASIAQVVMVAGAGRTLSVAVSVGMR